MKKAIIPAVVVALCVIGLVVEPVLGLRCKQIALNMSKNSVDDQYIGCDPKRELELNNSGKIPLPEKYFETWEKAQQHWAEPASILPNFNKSYGIAIMAYTAPGHLYKDFDTAARGSGKSQSSYEQYAFKDFHLLLTKALQAKKIQDTCYEVFRGINDICFNVSNKAVIRFGQFASSSLDKTVAQGFGEATFFSIRTCHGVRIDDISYKEEQKEVLIPPYETFTVTNYTKTHKGIFIRLESLSVYSRFNCEALKAAGFLTPVEMTFLLWSLLLTWIGSL